MTEDNSLPTPDLTPRSPAKQPDNPTGVKLSDLNAVKQQILTHAAVTLTGIGLTATAAGTIGQLMPKFGDVAPGPYAYPVLVYLAALILTYAGFIASMTMRLSPELETQLLARLSSEAGPPDAVSPELQRSFVKEFKANFERLKSARTSLMLGLILLQSHAIIITGLSYVNAADISQLLLSLGLYNLSEGAFNYYVLIIACVCYFVLSAMLRRLVGGWKRLVRLKPVPIPPEQERVE